MLQFAAGIVNQNNFEETISFLRLSNPKKEDTIFLCVLDTLLIFNDHFHWKYILRDHFSAELRK